MTRLKEGLSTATETAKRKVGETKQKIDKRLNQNLFEGIIAGCVLIMHTSSENKTEQDRANEEHKLLISLAEKGITKYFTQEEVTGTLAKYMSVFEDGNFIAGYGFCVATIARIQKDADMAMLIRFMYDISAADGHSDPEERQTIVDVAGYMGYANYATVEPQLSGYMPFRISDEKRRLGSGTVPKPDAGANPPSPKAPLPPPAPPASPSSPEKTPDKTPDKKDAGMPDWMRK
jgi:tellurite resistance protein